MVDRVVFDEETDPVFRASPARSAEQGLVERGIAHNIKNAKLLLALFGAILIGGAFYFLASAIPETPVLGQDIPREGERIPSNRTI